MKTTSQLRKADMEALLGLIDTDISGASEALVKIRHAEDSIYRQSSSAAGLEVLSAMAEVALHAQSAVQTLALALAERGEKSTNIARAANVNRATVNRWRRESSDVEGELSDSNEVGDT